MELGVLMEKTRDHGGRRTQVVYEAYNVMMEKFLRYLEEE